MKKTIITTVVMLLCVLCFVGLKHMYWQAKRKAPRAPCAANLSSIGRVMAVYALDHNENFPTNFRSLVTNYVNHPKLFVCPKAKAQAGSISNVDKWTSYTLITNASDASDIWAFCTPNHHKGKGCNILHLDGSVWWVKTDEFEKLLKEQGLSHLWKRH
ncbi:hypothetical protein ACFLS1_11515 [Verrucomicrobiota bacterium]